ncbi:iron complex transport system permease protein [Lipingzhangella halophila]|uniref:Iron complex transport system permease protein n=1 Tax=Lipingzhangella halophila TaxID=1783352 RepID=A0A7W7W1F8_9ACTN|nr:iron ABC transporter permease [Lipingzhangella halophila]MBB4929640.1 iron complex transport system permease protein [Lipingzhangella halophila]
MSLQWRTRPLLVALGVLAVLLAAFVRALLSFDDYPMSVADVLRTLTGGGDGGETFVLFTLRMPRALTAALVGAALGLAGAIMQSLTRNPLASPDTLGVMWGASVGAIAVIVFGGSTGQVSGLVSQVGVPVGALVGGLVTSAVVFGLAWSSGLEPTRLLLMGVAASLFCANLVYWAMSWTEVQDATRAQTWLTGSMHAADWDRVGPAALALAVLLPLCLAAAHALGALVLGDDTARGLGVRVERARLLLLLIATLLACVAVSAAGPITFVALAAPQIALRLCKLAYPPLATSMLLGSALTLIADQIAAGLFPVALPVGVFTAVLGAPYLMYLIVRRHREQHL